MSPPIKKLQPGQKVVSRPDPSQSEIYECQVFEVAEVCEENRECYVRTTCDRVLAVREIELLEEPMKRGYHPNSRANLKKGPKSRKKTRVRKLFSLAPETVEWLQAQPIPASQAIDKLVALAKQSEASCQDLPQVGSKVEILEGPQAGRVGKVYKVGVRVWVEEIAEDPPELPSYPLSSLKEC
ncbi:hypothetical protein [Phormidium sp. CCY1219]|uniref:hypothetical protein n=1 Tax=Phormidium sp. CCY1219 TaxID=2886104 RepID=UPI002D1F54B5|nr:hypothetical protein [Phormidium sp. CCY1219]MEB3826105.1 hypothetical protein [Phormidium sp. CCY1219]